MQQGFSGNSAYLCQLYMDELHRPVDSSGLSTFGSYLNSGGSRYVVAYLLDTSAEYRTHLINNIYQRLLNRSADPGGFNAFFGALGAGTTDELVLSEIAGSPEFFNDAGGSNAGFLNLLYRDILGRSPDSGGFNQFNGLLNSGFSRQQVAYALLDVPGVPHRPGIQWLRDIPAPRCGSGRSRHLGRRHERRDHRRAIHRQPHKLAGVLQRRNLLTPGAGGCTHRRGDPVCRGAPGPCGVKRAGRRLREGTFSDYRSAGEGTHDVVDARTERRYVVGLDGGEHRDA